MKIPPFGTVEINTAPAEAYIKELSARAGVPIETVVRAEAAAILQTTMNRTSVKKTKTVENQVRRKFNNFSDRGHGKGATGRPKISQGKNKIWMLRESPKKGLTFLQMDGTRRWSEKIWNKYQQLLGNRDSQRKIRTQEMLQRRGLQKQSWYLLGQAIGAKLKAAGYIVNAKSHGRVIAEVARTLIDKRPAVFSILFQNFSKAARYWKAENKLLGVLRGRVKFFEQNLRRGVFKDAAAIAKKYPGITVK